ncbi:MAG: flagellar hook-length control protein FliK [Halomonas sp. 54_146]|nr:MULTISPECIES: flagellar hook-length control protein FliK [unclassified Halomonas]KUJ89096.1 MAG: flagellar hook-length control protein FliK [Halomonas sp. 54_146]HAA45440.1 hypothetical protein [Halomonas sp.]
MNLHPLLSVNPSSPQTPSQGARGGQESPNGLFRQALLNASGTQTSSSLSPQAEADSGLNDASRQARLTTSAQGLSEALNVDVENLADALEALGIDLSESDLSAVLAQLQTPNADISAAALTLDDAETSTGLDEIASRLALMASFDDSRPLQPAPSAALETIAEQLNIDQREAAQLVSALSALMAQSQPVQSQPAQNLGAYPSQAIQPAALETIAEQLNIDQSEAAQLVSALNALMAQSQSVQSQPAQNLGAYPSQAIQPAALETIAEQLNIDQREAAQLVSALSALMAQNQPAQSQPVQSQVAQNQSAHTVAINSARLPSVDKLPVDLNTTPRPGNFLAQLNTSSASPQVSSEALMSALLTLEGAAKASPAGEQLFTSPSLTANQPPLTSSQAAQGFAPTVPPTQASLSTPVTSNAWPQQLSQQLVQISQRGGEQHVQMQLHPAELGPLSISLKFSEQGAQAHFLSTHAQVRQVLEQAIPQLREALAEQGISLGETSVGEQRDPNTQGFAQSGGKQGSQAGGDNGDIGLDETPALSAESSPLILDGRVDLYA